MILRTSRALAAVVAAATVGALAIALPTSASAAPTPPWASVHINEVSSDNGSTPVGDAIELFNSSDAEVSIAGWLQIDSGDASAAKTFSATSADGTATTVVPAHGYVYFASTKGLGSSGDGVKLYLPDGANGTAGTLVDEVAYTAGEAGTDEGNNFGAGAFARCPDGTGAFVSVAAKSFGASNAAACQAPLTNPADGGSTPLACQPEAPSGTGTLPATALTPGAWPGSPSVAVSDNPCAWTTTTGPEGRDISGVVFAPSSAGVMYAIKNKSWVFRLVKQDGLWVSDTSNGWGAGKEIFFPGSTDSATNQPDSEGLTIGPDGALYVTTERNNAANTIPLNSILRIDPTQSGTQLVATDQWDLTAEFPELHAGSKTEANLGFEGVTFVPDSYLTGNGFVDASTGKTYAPKDYPSHGTGLYFAALENDGKLYAYALNSDHTFHRVAVVDTGMGHVMDVQFDADNQRIWALCDNTCGVTSTVLKVGSTGSIVPEVAYSRPDTLPDNNIEGFALAPDSTCVDGTKEVVWADDGIYGAGTGSATEGHALFSGRITCDLQLGEQGVPVPAGPDAWVKTKVYNTGDEVSYDGKVFRALWYTSGQTPGASVSGAWAEIADCARRNRDLDRLTHLQHRRGRSLPGAHVHRALVDARPDAGHRRRPVERDPARRAERHLPVERVHRLPWRRESDLPGPHLPGAVVLGRVRPRFLHAMGAVQGHRLRIARPGSARALGSIRHDVSPLSAASRASGIAVMDGRTSRPMIPASARTAAKAAQPAIRLRVKSKIKLATPAVRKITTITSATRRRLPVRTMLCFT